MATDPPFTTLRSTRCRGDGDRSARHRFVYSTCGQAVAQRIAGARLLIAISLGFMSSVMARGIVTTSCPSSHWARVASTRSQCEDGQGDRRPAAAALAGAVGGWPAGRAAWPHPIRLRRPSRRRRGVTPVSSSAARALAEPRQAEQTQPAIASKAEQSRQANAAVATRALAPRPRIDGREASHGLVLTASMPILRQDDREAAMLTT